MRGSTLWTPYPDAHEVASIRRAVGKLVREGEGVLFAPHRPGLYLVVDRPSPTRTIYCLGRDPESDAEMIARLKARNVSAALITTTTIDGDPTSSLAALHPELVRYLNENYHRDPGALWGLPGFYQVFSRRRLPG